jgi:hypothetical protein
MSQNQKSTGIPGWAKALIVVAGVGGALAIVYYAITNIFSAGVNAYKTIYEQEYSDLLQKMAGYVQQNGSSQTGFTATQEQAITVENTALANTAKGLTAAANAETDAVVEIALGIVAGAAIVAIFGIGFPAYLKYRLTQTGKTEFTQYAITYATIGAVADDLNSMGGLASIQASNMISSAQQMFQTYSLPAMQQLQAGLQADLANLVGAELLTAQEWISLLTDEMAYIPTLLLVPPLAM